MNQNINIEAFDEFGFILWYHLPRAYDLYLNNKLNSTYSKSSTKELFYFSENHTEMRKHNNNLFEHREQCYGHDAPIFTHHNWTPPPLNEYYQNDTFKFDKPILTIHNKNTIEWGVDIFNFFDTDALEKLFILFKDDYNIIYIRPPYTEEFGYQKDDNQSIINIGDEELLKKYNIMSICDILKENNNISYNLVQFMVLANSNKHITPAGDAVIPSYFGGDTLIYNHPNCGSSNRGVWKTNSWLKSLSNSNIYGFNSYDKLIEKSIELWK